MTPYGVIEISRFLYQSSSGGKSFCPLEHSARIVRTATPKLGKTISHKHSKQSTHDVQEDLLQNHSLSLPITCIKETTEHIASIAQSNEDNWSYTPKLDEKVHSISIGLDGTCMYLIENDFRGWREAMVGTISLNNKEGNRLHTTYLATTPEYGKSEFYGRMDKEILKVKELYPLAKTIGIADGASSNWLFLNERTDIQITDFWHATEYLKGAATALFSEIKERDIWLDKKCHQLKHKPEAAPKITKEMEALKLNKRPSGEGLEKILKAITYFTNQRERMKYDEYIENGYSIGSGVTEAACKTVIKQRLCKSGMRWKKNGSSAILKLRCLILSNQWEQFWEKISRNGVAA